MQFHNNAHYIRKIDTKLIPIKMIDVAKNLSIKWIEGRQYFSWKKSSEVNWNGTFECRDCVSNNPRWKRKQFHWILFSPVSLVYRNAKSSTSNKIKSYSIELNSRAQTQKKISFLKVAKNNAAFKVRRLWVICWRSFNFFETIRCILFVVYDCSTHDRTHRLSDRF